MTIFWFRRDLRIIDNRAFYEALLEKNVLPIFIFDTNILRQVPKNDHRVSFIYKQLEKLNNHLLKYQKSLATFYGDPLDILSKIVQKHGVKTVYANQDYEPYAIQRDQRLKDFFEKKNTVFKTYKDQVIFEKDEVTKENGSPYVVFTPYCKKWKEKLQQQVPLEHYPSENLLPNLVSHPYPFFRLEEIGFSYQKIVYPLQFSEDIIKDYHQYRDFPALQRTSYLGLYLRFGVFSIRQIIAKAILYGNEIFINELVWREFFMQILWHFPYTAQQCFKPAYDHILWENNETFFQKWCDGKTGYPLVDAGMRQLHETGFMHNRVRMIVASFLCKHLLIDWRWGEAYFAQKLLDYEQASNIGNWQWTAGCGVDAAPYFRIFNPVEQQKKFDKNFEYCKQWIPELFTPSYPNPIVNHKIAREKCLRVYKDAITGYL